MVQKLKSWYFIFFQVIKEYAKDAVYLNKPLSRFSVRSWVCQSKPS